MGASQPSVSLCRKWEPKNWRIQGQLVGSWDEEVGRFCRGVVTGESLSHGGRGTGVLKEEELV